MWTTGADVMQRIAAPVIGGMVSSTVLTLLMIPVLYMLWRSRSVPSGDQPLRQDANLVGEEQEKTSIPVLR
jgi:hypothetical protein